MKKSIFKYNLEITDSQIVALPIGSQILTIQSQFEQPKLWALVSPSEEKEDRVIEIFGTGHPIDCDYSIERKYISTFQMSDGNYVFHAFEKILS